MANDTNLMVSEPAQLLAFLLANFPGKGRNKVKALLTHHLVTVDDKIVTRHDHPLQSGQRVTVRGAQGPVKDGLHGIRILFEDANLIVIDKPPGLLSMATEEEHERTAYRMLMDYVKTKNKDARVFIVHRLDKDTSGVMMFARNEGTQQTLQNSWKETVVERSYVAVVEGHLKQQAGTISTWLKESTTRTMYVSKPGEGQKAVTHYQVLESRMDFSLVEVRLETGKKNQIRVHMQHLGNCVVGDRRYGSIKDPLKRLGLHARVLSFHHPVTGEVLRFETAIPPSFRSLFPGMK